MIIEWPKEISTCHCLLRRAYKEFRESKSEWTKRIREHYLEQSDCLGIALNNPVLPEAKTPHSLENLVASFWRIDEEDLSEEWGIKSKGLNNE